MTAIERNRGPRSSPPKGRGTGSNPANRFDGRSTVAVDDGWWQEEEPPPLPTTVAYETTKRIITRNNSPDIPFNRSLNPYQGCEHGCIYCYARPTHAYLGLSPGLDFETRLYAKKDAASCLAHELARPGYVAEPIMLGANTDPYQPIERRERITRRILEVLAACRHPLAITTKSALVLRDLDILKAMAADNLINVGISLTTLDPSLARRMEPRAAAPEKRLRAIAALAGAGVPVRVLAAPMIPFVNDHELEALLEAAVDAGASAAGYTLVRLPHEIKELFRDWLAGHFPDRAMRVESAIRACRGGALYVSDFATRMRGTGTYAAMLEKRFAVACRRLGLNRSMGGGRSMARLNSDLFRPPQKQGAQLSLGFD